MAVRRTHICPEELAYLGPGWEWHLLLPKQHAPDDEAYGVAAFFSEREEASLHLRLRSFGPRTARYLVNDVKEMHRICRDRGVRRVAGVAADPGDPRFARFVRRFGFSEPVPLLVAYMEVPHGEPV